MGSQESDSTGFNFQKKKQERKKKSPANSHIFGSEGQLLFDTVLISGEDQIFLVLMYRFSPFL